MARRHRDHGTSWPRQASASPHQQETDTRQRDEESGNEAPSTTAASSQDPSSQVKVKSKVNYTREAQRSPERKRGRAPVLGRTALKSRFSLAELLTASPCKVARVLMEAASARVLDNGSWKNKVWPFQLDPYLRWLNVNL